MVDASAFRECVGACGATADQQDHVRDLLVDLEEWRQRQPPTAFARVGGLSKAERREARSRERELKTAAWREAIARFDQRRASGVGNPILAWFALQVLYSVLWKAFVWWWDHRAS